MGFATGRILPERVVTRIQNHTWRFDSGQSTAYFIIVQTGQKFINNGTF